jgi:hypothetical protein
VKFMTEDTMLDEELRIKEAQSSFKDGKAP